MRGPNFQLRPQEIIVKLIRTLTILTVLAIWAGALTYAHGQTDPDALIKTPAVLAAIGELHSHTFTAGVDKTEYSIVIRADGSPSKPQSSHDWSSNHLTVAIGSDLAIVHSHPTGTAPQPSEWDLIAAKRCGIRNYEVSFYYIYVAEPDGKTIRKVANLSTGKHGILVIKWLP